jgi:AcrR family transcriptional regulator
MRVRGADYTGPMPPRSPLSVSDAAAIHDGLRSESGFAVPRYRNAVKTTTALLDAGRELLADRTPDALTISELCAHAGVTTGAFYGRFEGKDAFVRALLAVAARDLRERLQECARRMGQECGSLEEGARMLMAELRSIYLMHAGVMRGALMQVDGRQLWTPIRSRREAFQGYMMPVLESLIGKSSASMRTRMTFAIQFTYGTLLAAVLIDPGPYSLDDPRLELSLAEAFCSYVRGSEVPAA